MSQIFTRPVTQEQIDAAKKRREAQTNAEIQLAMDYLLTDLMTRIGELESKAEGTEPK